MLDLSNILEEEFKQMLSDTLESYESAEPVSKASGRTGEALELVMIDAFHAQMKGNSYSGVLEAGRRAGKVPKGFYRIIQQWAEAKGIAFSSASEFNRFCYFTAQKIAREGTSLYVRGGRTDIFTEPLEAMTQRLTEQLSGLFSEEINNQLFTKP